MTARYQAVGKPAHRQEIDALKFLIRGLPEGHMLYANSWLAERDGALYELDAVVVAPHAVFIPAAVMFLTVLAINVLGEATRRLFDIRAQSL